MHNNYLHAQRRAPSVVKRGVFDTGDDPRAIWIARNHIPRSKSLLESDCIFVWQRVITSSIVTLSNTLAWITICREKYTSKFCYFFTSQIF